MPTEKRRIQRNTCRKNETYLPDVYTHFSMLLLSHGIDNMIEYNTITSGRNNVQSPAMTRKIHDMTGQKPV